MYRVVASASNVRDYESYLSDIGIDYDAQASQNAVRRFDQVMADAEGDGADVADFLSDYSFDGDYDPEIGAEITAICDYLGISTRDVVRFRENSDSDFCAVTLKDGTIRYFFDRGVAYDGLKDAETGELLGI